MSLTIDTLQEKPPDKEGGKVSAIQDLWAHICKELRKRVSEDSFERWFAPCRLISVDEVHFCLDAPSEIYGLWIESNYMEALQEVFEEILQGRREVIFRVMDSKDSVASMNSRDSGINNKEKVEQKGLLPPMDSSSIKETKLLDPRGKTQEKQQRHAGLNIDKTFDCFVVGSNNEFAHAASQGVADKPGNTYNPLFIHGGVGLGKTHLIHAIGCSVLQRNPKAKLLYLTSEDFTNQFIEAIQTNTLTKFRRRYRRADLLLIDDIQFFRGKERSQEEFFHTFNSLFDGHKQIVLASDRPPGEISQLEERLVSRFEWGLTAEILPPDVETRMAILYKKLAVMNTTLDKKIVEFLAERITRNVRRLEGALTRVASLASLYSDVTVDRVEEWLRDLLQEESSTTITIDRIQKCVAEHFDIRIADMTSKRRPANVAWPRQIAMYLSRELTKSSLNEVGEAFGGRDHGTVIHACRAVKKKMETQKEITIGIGLLESKLKTG